MQDNKDWNISQILQETIKMKCPYCGDEIPEYSNLDFHVQTEHGFSVPAQYTQDTITRAMKDPDNDRIESFEYTQKQLEDAKNWWEKAKLPHETEPWNELRIGARQKIIGRYADYMYNKHITGEGQRDLKPTGKNHGIDFYTDMALDDYMNNTYHTPEEYENALYGIDSESYGAEDTAMKRYGVPRKLPNGDEIVDSAYGTELHAKDWWDSKTVKNEKGDGKSRKWEDLDPSERKGIREIFEDKVKGDYLRESFDQLMILDQLPIGTILTMMVQRVLPDLEFLPSRIQRRVHAFVSGESVGEEWFGAGEDDDPIRIEDQIKLLRDLGIADKTLRELGYIIPHETDDGTAWIKEANATESWNCSICGKEFGVAGNSGEGERFQHLMSHKSKSSEALLICPNCNSLDILYSELGSEWSKCNNCGEEFIEGAKPSGQTTSSTNDYNVPIERDHAFGWDNVFPAHNNESKANEEFREEEHPRDHGKFAKKNGSSDDFKFTEPNASVGNQKGWSTSISGMSNYQSAKDLEDDDIPSKKLVKDAVKLFEEKNSLIDVKSSYNGNGFSFGTTERMDGEDVSVRYQLEPIIKGGYRNEQLVGFHFKLPSYISADDLKLVGLGDHPVKSTPYNRNGFYQYLLISAKNINLLQTIAEKSDDLIDLALKSKLSSDRRDRERKEKRVERIKTVHDTTQSFVKGLIDEFELYKPVHEPNRENQQYYNQIDKDGGQYIIFDKEINGYPDNSLYIKPNYSKHVDDDVSVTYDLTDSRSSSASFLNKLNEDEVKSIIGIVKNKIKRKEDTSLESVSVEFYFPLEATEGGFGSGRKGHSSWMRDMEYGGNYKVCPNCNVNTSFENNKCLICGN